MTPQREKHENWEVPLIETKRKQKIQLIFLPIYIFTVLWFIVLSRPTGYHVAQLELFWSYKRWLAGDMNLGIEIMANIAMFVPYGFLMSLILPIKSRGKKAAVTVITAFLFSFTIESLQLYFMRGLFEWDDMVSNTCGGIVGVILHRILEKVLKERTFGKLLVLINAVFMAGCLGVFIYGLGSDRIEADTTSRSYCVQIDEVTVTDGVLTMNGFALRYGHSTDSVSFVLRPAEGEEVELDTTYGTARPDVNEYFLCDHDYTPSGFTAHGKIENKEYEVMIEWPWSIPISTGVFISSSGVHYMPEKDFVEPSGGPDLERIVKNRVLRLYRPDYHCWVYQVSWDLYWITEDGFQFEEDGSTYIQYQLWTTQPENLPEKRRAHNHRWDNIGGRFEKYEIEGDFGAYRVMKREIPTDYSVTSIMTGYRQNGKWVWKNYFRPYYVFGE